MTRSEPLQKPIYLLKRNPGLSPTEFCDHWFNVHATLLRGIPEFAELRSGYVQNHVVAPDPRGEAPFPFDGVTQVYVKRGAEGLTPFPEMEVFRKRVIPDEEAMLDRAASIVLKTHEHIMIPGQGASKVLIFHRKRPGMPLQEFNAYWIGKHREVVLAQKDFVSFIRGYRQNHLIPGTCRYMTGPVVTEGEAFDGVSELWFDSPEAAREAFKRTGYATHVRADVLNVFDAGRDIACIVDARVIIAE